MAADSKDWDRLYDLLRDGFEGVHDRLDQLNGRTRTVENKVAVLEDRGVRSKDQTARWGAAVIGTTGVLVELAKQMWGGK